MSFSYENNTENLVSQEMLDELVKLGVGGKYKDTSNYLELLKEEIKHENIMMRGGIRRYRKQVTDAKAKQQESVTDYGIKYQYKYIDLISDYIHKDVRETFSGHVRKKATAILKIVECLPHTAFEGDELKPDLKIDVWDNCSLIVLRNVIDGISSEVTAQGLALDIGNALEMEARITLFEARHKDKYNWIKNVKLAEKNIAQKKSRYKHKKNVWTYYMNKNNLEFDSWSKEDKLHLGMRMIYYCQTLGLIKLQNRRTRKNRVTMYVDATPKILDEIEHHNISTEALTPKFRVMFLPPLKWTSPFSGGYYAKKYNLENKAEEIIETINHKKVN